MCGGREVSVAILGRSVVSAAWVLHEAGRGRAGSRVGGGAVRTAQSRVTLVACSVDGSNKTVYAERSGKDILANC